MKMKYVLIALSVVSVATAAMAKQAGETAHPVATHKYTYE